MLAILDADIVRRSIAGMVVLFGAVIATGWRYKGEVTKALSAAIRTVGGLCSGIASLGGPPVVMFPIAKGSNAAQTWAGIIAFFGLAMLLCLAAFSVYDLYSAVSFWLSLLLATVYISGIWVGS